MTVTSDYFPTDAAGLTPACAPMLVDVADGASPGDPVVRDGVEIGTYTSVAGARALATVKRSALGE